ncbi:MAG: radical SAM family heme chaperone HemW [Acidimicrobiia bacterium]|nr:radical SAM family heme chaperone HemW [Acidimicrobiia bacterium]
MSDWAIAAAAERSVYVHIPFCHRQCPYCDFAVVDMSTDTSPVDRYVAAVEAEIGMAAPWGELHAVNLGGGTPSILAASQVERVVAALRRRFGLAAGAEVSIEANPEDVTLEYAEALVAAGVNRISLGVQSFDGAVLRYLGRAHTPDQAAAAVRNARAAGMRTVNLDLILGSPGESLDSWLNTVRTALLLGTEHLSAYALTVERGTSLSRSVTAGAAAPDPDDQADKYEALEEAAELEHYEVSNWAAPGHQCRYNLTTWSQGEYEAIGLGAHGHRNGARTRNYRRLDVYLDHVEAGRRPVQGSEAAGPWERERERVFLGLRVRAGVEAGSAGCALLDSAPGRRFLAAGVIELAGSTLVVTRPLLTDAVAREVLTLPEPT